MALIKTGSLQKSSDSSVNAKISKVFQKVYISEASTMRGIVV